MQLLTCVIGMFGVDQPISNLLWMTRSDCGPIANTITQHSLVLWHKLGGPFKFASPHAALLSFLSHPAFYPAYSNPASFRLWQSLGFTRISNLGTNTGLKTFATLQQQFQVPSPEYFCYLQLAHFLMTTIRIHSSLTSLSLFKGICNSDLHASGILLHLYTHLTSPPVSMPSYTAQCFKDLEVDLEAEGWDDIWATTKSSAQNILALETNYKVLM